MLENYQLHVLPFVQLFPQQHLKTSSALHCAQRLRNINGEEDATAKIDRETVT